MIRLHVVMAYIHDYPALSTHYIRAGKNLGF